MANYWYILYVISWLLTATAVGVPRQVASKQYTNSSVTSEPSSITSAPGAFCCQVYVPMAALHWWYTNATMEVVDRTVLTRYVEYNNTIIPTATVTVTNTSAADVTGGYLSGANAADIAPTFSGIPTAMNAPFHGGNPYDVTIVQTETEADYGYTTM